MAFWDNLGDKLTQTSQSAVQKTKDMAETLRLSNLISEKEKRCGELYQEIGRRWYEQLSGEAPEPFRAEAAEVRTLLAELDGLRESVRQLKGVQVCPACGKEQPYGAAFCNGCGGKLPDPPAPPAGRTCPACGAALCALILLLCLTACGGGDQPRSTPENEPAQTPRLPVLALEPEDTPEPEEPADDAGVNHFADGVLTISKNTSRVSSAEIDLAMMGALGLSYSDDFYSPLTKVELPYGLTEISSSAFLNYANLTEINIPDSVTAIGSSAFRMCSSLASISIPGGVSVLSSGVFEKCTNLASVELPDGLTEISNTNNTNNTTNTRNPFTDVPSNTYYTDAVLWALNTGVTTGATATTFEPYTTCTRGQVVTFLWRAKGSPEPATKTNPFRDVRSTSPYYKAILWAAETGITTGTSSSAFSPNDTCTNGHVVTFLWRAEGKPAASGSSTLASSFATDYYTDAVAWADSAGLLANAGPAFNPANQSPRANIVTYLYRDLANPTSAKPATPTTPSTPSTPTTPSTPSTPATPATPTTPTTSNTPSTTTTPSTTSGTTAKLANGMDMTAENVRAVITGLKSSYPDGMRWTNDNSYVSKALRTTGYGCAGFALICSDAAFGSLPVSEKHSDFDRIRVGDMLRVNNDTHSVVVLEKLSDSVIVAEGNYNSAIYWGREISRQSLEAGSFYAETRYPA